MKIKDWQSFFGVIALTIAPFAYYYYRQDIYLNTGYLLGIKKERNHGKKLDNNTK